ncbi:MAG: hypothetical protein LUG65_02090, partial [Clostridiales bacterium]|nr:hypothetical protein [Clostridiales bacterium]
PTPTPSPNCLTLGKEKEPTAASTGTGKRGCAGGIFRRGPILVKKAVDKYNNLRYNTNRIVMRGLL